MKRTCVFVWTLSVLLVSVKQCESLEYSLKNGETNDITVTDSVDNQLILKAKSKQLKYNPVQFITNEKSDVWKLYENDNNVKEDDNEINFEYQAIDNRDEDIKKRRVRQVYPGSTPLYPSLPSTPGQYKPYQPYQPYAPSKPNFPWHPQNQSYPNNNEYHPHNNFSHSFPPAEPNLLFHNPSNRSQNSSTPYYNAPNSQWQNTHLNNSQPGYSGNHNPYPNNNFPSPYPQRNTSTGFYPAYPSYNSTTRPYNGSNPPWQNTHLNNSRPGSHNPYPNNNFPSPYPQRNTSTGFYPAYPSYNSTTRPYNGSNPPWQNTHLNNSRPGSHNPYPNNNFPSPYPQRNTSTGFYPAYPSYDSTTRPYNGPNPQWQNTNFNNSRPGSHYPYPNNNFPSSHPQRNTSTGFYPAYPSYNSTTRLHNGTNHHWHNTNFNNSRPGSHNPYPNNNFPSSYPQRNISTGFYPAYPSYNSTTRPYNGPNPQWQNTQLNNSRPGYHNHYPGNNFPSSYPQYPSNNSHTLISTTPYPTPNFGSQGYGIPNNNNIYPKPQPSPYPGSPNNYYNQVTTPTNNTHPVSYYNSSDVPSVTDSVPNFGNSSTLPKYPNPYPNPYNSQPPYGQTTSRPQGNQRDPNINSNDPSLFNYNQGPGAQGYNGPPWGGPPDHHDPTRVAPQYFDIPQ